MTSKHISQLDLANLYSKEVKDRGKKAIKDTLNFSKASSQNLIAQSIFLSHSHLDKTIVEKISVLFDRLGIELYIDWLDTTMPETTNNHTASVLRDKIGNCKKFIFLATYNALRSKWCNWELGLAFASRKETDFAIFPIETRTGKWPGNEYLNLYPEIKITTEIENLNASDVMVSMTNGSEQTFLYWLQN